MSTLTDPRVVRAIDDLFGLAVGDEATAAALVADGFYAKEVQERADVAAEVCMPISREAGSLLYTLVRAARPATVVEFGTSYGLSTLYLAAAVRDNGAGRVVTTELSAHKVAAARRTFDEVGLDDVIEVREGDARETLADLPAVDFLLLDGWNDLYVPLLQQLEPVLAPGTLVLGDDSSFDDMAAYLAYVRDPANGYHSVEFPVADGIEISCRL